MCFDRCSRCLADSWIPPSSPPSMAADSMEIDDSLYRQVYHFGCTSPCSVVFLTEAFETNVTDKVTRQSRQEMTVLCFIPQSVKFLNCPSGSLGLFLILPLPPFSPIQPPAICAGRQCYVPDGPVLSLSQWDGRTGN